MQKYDLQERLIDFAVAIINITKEIENSKAGNHLAGQIIRSGSSPSLNYSEAQSAESRSDFIHKMSIVLKELRETFSCLKIIERATLYNRNDDKISNALKESNELVSIFVKSIETAKSKLSKK
jgi:four helix bundle protein